MTPSVPDDAFLAAIQEAQASLTESVERAGLRDDPIRYPLLALGAVVGLFPEFLRLARQPFDPVSLARLEVAAVKGSDRRAAELARVHNGRTLIVGLCGAVVLAASFLAVGYVWGSRDVAGTALQAEHRVTAAFREGPDAAASWANLMELNDLPHALSLCAGPRVYADPSGRRVCALPLYIDPAKRAASADARR